MPKNSYSLKLSNWSPPPEQIEDIIPVKLSIENQIKLNCIVNEDIFLEYPWAYIRREKLFDMAAEVGLDFYKSKIEGYKPEWMLIGYASAELASTHFVVCLTESARDLIVSRNHKIKKNIDNKVLRMMEKFQSLADKKIIKPENVKCTDLSEPLFEIEINLRTSNLGKPRQLSSRKCEDTRDGCIELLLPPNLAFGNVPMKLITKSLQTTQQSISKEIQTYLGYPKNKWTNYDLFPPEETGEVDEPSVKQLAAREESSPTGHSETVTASEEKISSKQHQKDVTDEQVVMQRESLKRFFQTYLDETTDCVRYNSEINMHSDDIENLATIMQPECAHETAEMINYFIIEKCFLVDLSIVNGKVISDVAWHPNRPGSIAISYVRRSTVDLIDLCGDQPQVNYEEELRLGDNQACILVWSICDPLKPKLVLENCREIQVLSFCPSRDSVIVAGSTTGQVILWDLKKALDLTEENGNIARIQPEALSDPNNSHQCAIRGIHWLPSSCRLESTGKFSKIPDNMSMQFMTASEDGTVAFWDLLWQPDMQTPKSLINIVSAKMSLTDDLDRLDNIFHPHYRLILPPNNKEASYLMMIVDLCPASEDAYSHIQSDTGDPGCNDFARRLWLGTVQGEIVLISWRGQEIDEISQENTEVVTRSGFMHDGPIIRILRSSHLPDVLLTIGGSIFAIWKDNFLRRPLLWRKRKSMLTSCRWSDKPGVFLVTRSDGELETWDICRKTREPVHVQTTSGTLVAGVYVLEGGLVGACDYNGGFRVFDQLLLNDNLDYCARIEWFRKFIDREADRKREFYRWQDDYLKCDKTAVARKEARVAEETKRRHEEAREKFLKEQQEQARLKAERRAMRIPKSKETILKNKNIERMQSILLEKKGFSPKKLDEKKSPIVKQQEEKMIRMIKAREKVANQDGYFEQALVVEFPGATAGYTHGHEPIKSTADVVFELMSISKDEQSYSEVRGWALTMLDNAEMPKFEWDRVMAEARRRRDTLRNMSLL
uniref:WD repeat-containing protein 63 n=1 Tax=Bracon brevicornis TaxID=1563983 RepID=A0A6V7LD16_9HYME